MSRLTVEQIKEKIAEERERIRTKVQPEIEDRWKHMEEEHATDTAERNATVEVHRERLQRQEEQQQGAAGQPVPQAGDTTEEVTQMAVSTATREPYTKEKQVGKKRAKATAAHNATLARAQAGTKKGTASQRVKAAGKPKNGNGKENGQKVGKFDAQAKKSGVEIKLWKKGSQADPKHVSVVFYVLVSGTRSRALPDNFESLADAKKACRDNGYTVKAEPEKAAK